METQRPSPEELLYHIHQQQDQSTHGKLKIFFGYAAGVGKTYTMLEAAHQAQKEGRDVVVGYVERHVRPETLALLDGLEQMPCKEVPYKGVMLKEFDLDEALARKPQLILVDELAHSNAPGCRHAKRYQDVGELLRAGIDVYTTVNVQHLESLNDLVASITGVSVSERIPDRIFDSADQVELVDIEPADLIIRLQAGKVYREGQAQRALNHFFSEENLTALREIALRRTADRLDVYKRQVVACLVFFITALLFKLDPLNYTPLLYDGTDKMWIGVEQMIGRSSCIVFLGMLLPFTRGKVKKGFFTWLFSTNITMIILILVIVGALGDFIRTQIYPIYAAASVAELGIFKRVDAL